MRFRRVIEHCNSNAASRLLVCLARPWFRKSLKSQNAHSTNKRRQTNAICFFLFFSFCDTILSSLLLDCPKKSLCFCRIGVGAVNYSGINEYCRCHRWMQRNASVVFCRILMGYRSIGGDWTSLFLSSGHLVHPEEFLSESCRVFGRVFLHDVR